MTVRYHIETTTKDGTTWRTTQPVPSWRRVAEWVARGHDDYEHNGGVERMVITRHSDAEDV